MNKRGTVFITVMIVSMVMIFIAVSASNMLLQDAHMIKHLKRSTQAQYLAEAGISDALARLTGSLSAITFNESLTIGNRTGNYAVAVTASGSKYLVSSTGTIEGVSRTVALELKTLYPEMMTYSIGTGGDINIKSIKGDITIKGDIHANGDMFLSEQGPSTSFEVQAYGDDTGKATCSGDNFSIPGVHIADLTNSGPNRPMAGSPNFPFSDFKIEAEANGVYYSSGQTFTDNDKDLSGGSAGITYVHGNATFIGNNTITGGFVATGNIELNNGNFITQNQDAGNRFPVFISNGALKLYGVFNTTEGNVVYATNSIKIRTPGGQSTVLGSVVSGGWVDVVANNDVTLTYFMVEAVEVVPGGMEVVSWNR